MPQEKVRCISPECGNLIQPATAKRTGGLCGPCDGEKKRAEQVEFIRENRKTVDPYAGIIDPVAILEIFHLYRAPDPFIRYPLPPREIESLYAELTPAQAGRLMNLAAGDLRDGFKDQARDIALQLAAFTDHNLDAMLNTWIELNSYYPALPFRHAGPTIRDRILHALRKRIIAVNTLDANHALSAAAWIGDTTIQSAFREFDSAPPGWAQGLHIPPSGYARTAGWELSGTTRRELTLDRAFAILATHRIPPPTESPSLRKHKSDAPGAIAHWSLS